MGREVRRVPATWEHPRDEHGHHIPMHKHFPYNDEEIAEGLRDGWLTNDPPNYGCDVMPQWPDSERTNYQMYEDTTEGTPISPVCATPKEIARWLADNGASAFAYDTATYDQWLRMISRGSSFSAMYSPATGMISGVAAVAEMAAKEEAS